MQSLYDSAASPPRAFLVTLGLVCAVVLLMTWVPLGAQAATQPVLTVASENTGGSSISGYYVVLSQDGSTVSTGFTPATFTLNSGQTYTVQADSYGSCNFAYWADTMSSSSQRTISITNNTGITAVYNCGTSAGSVLTVSSVDQYGNALTGYYTVLYSGDSEANSGFTPATFTTSSGEAYSVQVDNYGNCTFKDWSDGTTSNPRSFVATSATTTFTAVYSCSEVSSTSGIMVYSVNQDGSNITGYPVSVISGGETVTSDSTPFTFAANAGQSYELQAGNGSCIFSYWTGNDTTAPVSFTATSQGKSFEAVYDCNGGGSTTITVYAHRISASYWAPCFATICAAGTGPGASMYFALHNSEGTLIGTGFADENGLTFSGLTAGATYYLTADDCDSCHGSTHDVLFNHWGDGSASDPIAVVAGSSLDAWYNCTNGCAGG